MHSSVHCYHSAIWYSIIIICCDQPIIWFMHLSSINLNQPTSLYHCINFFLFCDKIFASKHWRGFILACGWVYLAPGWVCQDGEGKSWQREREASGQMVSTVWKWETWMFILAHIFLFFFSPGSQPSTFKMDLPISTNLIEKLPQDFPRALSPR